jgi:hypothetical protein
MCGPGIFLPLEAFSGLRRHVKNDGVPDNPNNNVPNN